MQYHIQSKFYGIRLAGLYLLVAIVLMCIELIGVTKLVGQMYSLSTKPIARLCSAFAYSLNATIEQLHGMWKAYDELNLVKKENAVLQAEVAQFETIRKENQALKELMGSSQVERAKKKLQVATVIGYSNPTIISEEHLLKTGQLVLSQETLLGITSSVFENQAGVTLLSSSQLSPILVKSESGIEGIVNGSNKQILMTDIPKDAQLKNGEKILTSGQDGVPANIFVGTVGRLLEEPTSPVLTYTVVQPVSFFNTTIVEIR